jgi:hypothetical protein
MRSPGCWRVSCCIYAVNIKCGRTRIGFVPLMANRESMIRGCAA